MKKEKIKGMKVFVSDFVKLPKWARWLLVIEVGVLVLIGVVVMLVI